MNTKQEKKVVPVKHYLVDEAALEPCDIIVTTTSDKVSRGIRMTTWGKFSHVTIYTGAGHYIDATNNGVQSNLLSRMLLEKLRYGRVLRFKGGLSPEQKSAIVSYVRFHIGKEYSIPQAILAGAPKIRVKPNTSNRQFCSRLVAEAYNEAGLSIVKHPSFCTPEQVRKSKMLEEVPNCIREASQEEIQRALSEGEELATPMMELHNEVLAKARELTKHDIQEFTTLTKCASEHPEFDAGIASILKSTGYLDFWKIEFDANPFLYDSEEFKRVFMTPKERHEAAIYFLKKNESVYPHYIRTQAALQATLKKKESLTARVQLELYEKLLSLHIQRAAIIAPYLTPIGAVEMERWDHLPPSLLGFMAQFLGEADDESDDEDHE